MTPANDPAESTGDTLTLETLGSAALLRVTRAGQRTLIFGRGKPLALIIYLASVPGASASREFLVDLLWADLEPDAARHAFRQTLWYIKQKAGRPIIRATADTVALAEPLASDRGEFLRAVEQHDFETAMAVYAGEFLPGFATPGGLQFEHWTDLERQRLRDTFARSAEQVVRQYLAIARHRDAVGIARRARDSDPLSEKAWRLLLEALVSSNDSLGASLEADALQQMLTAEEREPEPATRSMLRAVRQVSAELNPQGAEPAGIVAELVGREAEFSIVLAAWDEAKAGVPRHAFITGPAGIGKTRLIGDVVARLRAKRCRVVWVRAHPGEHEISYSLLSELAAGLAALPGAAAVSPASAAALVALNPTLSTAFSAAPDRSDGAESLRRRTIAVHELLAAAADEAPVAVIVDDLHWADRESARALAGVAERLQHQRVLLITAARPSNGSALPPAHSATVIRLSPLSVAEVGALLASIGALPDSPFAQRLPALLRDATDGVPLFVVETLQLLMERGLLAIETEAWVLGNESGLTAALSAGGALRRRIEVLDAAERMVLTAIAVAGVPVPAGFLGDVTQRSLPDVAAILHSLETRGMVNHVGDGWQPAHDQIGELALDGVAPEIRHAAERAVGRAWMHGDAGDQALRRAGMHFVRAGDRAATTHAFVLWTRRLRRLGDHRAPLALAAEFSDSEDSERLRELVRAIPFQYRYGSSRWRAAAAVVFVAAASAAATWQWSRPPAPAPDEQFLAVSVDSSRDTTIYRVGIRRDLWTGGDLLVVPTQGKQVHLTLPSTLNEYTVTGDDKSWISYATFPDSGGNDLVLEDMTGKRQRLTWAPGDDQGADIAPDGSRIVFATGRFDTLSHARLAIMDLATHGIRQLTVGSGSDGTPKWSPSGVRIAFRHLSYSEAPDSICTISPDGSGTRCFDVGELPTPIGWIDDNRLLVSDRRDSLTTLDILDVRDGSMRRVQQTGGAFYSLSPDGRWMYCQCRDIGVARPQPMIFPVDHPELSRPLVMSALDTRPVGLVWQSARPARFVTSLVASVPPHGIPLGAAFQLTTLGNTADGRRIVLPNVRITSLNTAVVRSEPHGKLVPLAPGTANLVISAGGWRTDTLAVRVVPPHDSIVLRDDWSHGIEPDFVPYGDPPPMIVRDSSGRPAFWNHGDGNFANGAHSRRTYSARDGLGFEAMLSLPITISQWQTESVSLVPLPDSAALARWNHRDGYPPYDAGTSAGRCFAAYPAAEGARGMHALSIPAAAFDLASTPWNDINDGRWFRVRIQIFPDGRCGVAIDGRPISITGVGVRSDARYLAVLDGNSYHTRVLTGPVDLWTGIRPGVDWLAFDTAQATPGRKRR
ncbi:MAG TPA: AAA family ATPase [Gemmatimonadaceae bacterium]|nr:AAA family ATPase [Gemmatimonadaceae bacterium]